MVQLYRQQLRSSRALLKMIVKSLAQRTEVCHSFKYRKFEHFSLLTSFSRSRMNIKRNYSQKTGIHSEQEHGISVSTHSGGSNFEDSLGSRKLPISADDIDSCILKRKDGFIAVNKPQNLAVFGSLGDTENSLKGMLEEQLKPKDDSSYLDVGLSLRSFYSGLVLLCSERKSKVKLEKIISGAAAQKVPFMSYLAITVGVPQCSHRQMLEGFISQQFLHGREMSVVNDAASHAARKAGQAMSVSYRIDPLVVSQDTQTALVEISLNKDRWSAVEVLLTHHLSPVLGDHVYSSRTYTILGVPFPASPHSALPGVQRLPQQTQKALNSKSTSPDKSTALALCVHRYKVTLNRFHQDNSPLVFTAPPPSEFLTTLHCLGLYDEELLNNLRNDTGVEGNFSQTNLDGEEWR